MRSSDTSSPPSRATVGFYVYTPLQLDTGEFVFVNRGFVPFDRKEAATRAQGQVGGRVTVTGLLRAGLTEKPSWLVPDNDPAKNIFYWKDIRAMARDVRTTGQRAGARPSSSMPMRRPIRAGCRQAASP